MTTYSTLGDVLRERANSNQSLTFITGQDQETNVPYRQLYANSLGKLATFQAKGIAAGDQLILLLGDNEHFITTFWACILGGIIPVPVAGGNSDEHRGKLFRIFDKLESGYLTTDESALGRLQKYAEENSLDANFQLLLQRTVLQDDSQPSDFDVVLHQADLDDTALIQFSSGSTSTPKGIVLTHRNLLTNIAAIIHAMALEPCDQFFGWMPLTHDMGLIGFHLTPVVADCNHALMPTDLFVRRPSLWLSKAQAHSSTILCSPNFGFQHYLKSFSSEKSSALDLSTVRLIFNGAEPISDELCDTFLSTMAPFGLKEETMYTVYGLAEASLAVSFPPLNTPFGRLNLDRNSLTTGQPIRTAADDNSDSVTFVNVGKPVKDCELKISDAEGTALPEGAVGHIRIRGDNVTAGYYREDAINAETIDSDGWLDTGDLGFTQNHSLYITGRAKDIIFINGLNFYPHDLERLLIDAGQAEYGKIAITSYRDTDNVEDKVLCLIQSRGDLEEFTAQAAEIKKALNIDAGVQVEHVVPIARIPKTTSGKVQRFRLAQNYLDGEYNDTLKTMSTFTTDRTDSMSTDSSIESTLTSICLSQVDDIPLTAADNLFEIGISSLTLAQIHEQIETTWPDQVDITDLFDYPSIAELAGFLESKLGVEASA